MDYKTKLDKFLLVLKNEIQLNEINFIFYTQRF